MDEYEMGLIPHIVFIDRKGDIIYSVNAFRFRFNDFRDTVRLSLIHISEPTRPY